MADGTWCPAWPLGQKLTRLEWPEPGSHAICQGGIYLRIVRIVLTVAHLDHQPENVGDDNLAALCQRCHNRYDAKMRAAGIRERARAAAALGDLFAEDAAE